MELFEELINRNNNNNPAEIHLMFRIEEGREQLGQKRVNFYMKNGFKLLHSKICKNTGYHMFWLV